MYPKIRYALDKSGVNPNNLVLDEPHHLLSGRERRSISPMYGAFFTESIVVTDRANGKALVKDADYYCSCFVEPAQRAYGKEIASMITITEPSVSDDVYITYQVLGGPYTNTSEAIRQLLEKLRLDDRAVLYDKIVNKPNRFVPTAHMHDAGDIYGLEYVVYAINQLADAIRYGDIRLIEEILKDKEQEKKILAEIEKTKTLILELDKELRALINTNKSNIERNFNDLDARLKAEIIDRINGDDNLLRLINEIKEACKNKEKEIRSLINDLYKRVNNNSSGLADVTSKVALLENSVNKNTRDISTNLDLLNSSQAKQDERISNLESGVNNNDRRITVLENRTYTPPPPPPPVSPPIYGGGGGSRDPHAETGGVHRYTNDVIYSLGDKVWSGSSSNRIYYEYVAKVPNFAPDPLSEPQTRLIPSDSEKDIDIGPGDAPRMWGELNYFYDNISLENRHWRCLGDEDFLGRPPSFPNKGEILIKANEIPVVFDKYLHLTVHKGISITSVNTYFDGNDSIFWTSYSDNKWVEYDRWFPMYGWNNAWGIDEEDHSTPFFAVPKNRESDGKVLYYYYVQ